MDRDRSGLHAAFRPANPPLAAGLARFRVWDQEPTTQLLGRCYAYPAGPILDRLLACVGSFSVWFWSSESAWRSFRYGRAVSGDSCEWQAGGWEFSCGSARSTSRAPPSFTWPIPRGR